MADMGMPDMGTMDTGTPDGATDSGDAAAFTCDPDAGALVAAPWGFGPGTPSQNGGKGQVLSVSRCDSVQWDNQDSTSHSVVSTGGGFSFSTAVNQGGKYAPIQFPMPGTFTYQCGIHGSAMIGQITVAP
jgi:hypothetical protein